MVNSSFFLKYSFQNMPPCSHPWIFLGQPVEVGPKEENPSQERVLEAGEKELFGDLGDGEHQNG